MLSRIHRHRYLCYFLFFVFFIELCALDRLYFGTPGIKQTFTWYYPTGMCIILSHRHVHYTIPQACAWFYHTDVEVYQRHDNANKTWYYCITLTLYWFWIQNKSIWESELLSLECYNFNLKQLLPCIMIWFVRGCRLHNIFPGLWLIDTGDVAQLVKVLYDVLSLVL